jgi:formate dehydrogenase major subunit
MTFHYAEAATNLLTIDAVDPTAKIPEFKVCAVQVERATRPVILQKESTHESESANLLV